MAGLALRGLHTVAFEVPDLDLELICEPQPARVDDERGRVEVPFVVAPVLPAWNPAVHEAMPPEILLDLRYYSPSLAAPGAVAPAVVVQYPSGGFETRLGFPTIPGSILAVEALFHVWLGFDRPTEWRGMNEESLPYG